jgi:hypothetical protein
VQAWPGKCVARRIAAVSLLLAGAARAQDVVAAMAQLQQPEQRAAACLQLERAGARAVMPLRELLQSWDREDAAAQEGAVVAGLYVLGKLGPLATSSLPECKRLLAFGRTLAVRDQALWAMGQLAPATGDKETCKECLGWLDLKTAADNNQLQTDIVWARLKLGPLPDEHQVTAMLQDDGRVARVMAAAQSIAAGQGRPSAEGWALLQRYFADATARPELPWMRCRRSDAATGDLAFAMLRAGGRRDDSAIARGLLYHWDPALRAQGLADLVDPARTTLAEKLDGVALLWHSDVQLRAQALRTLRGWERDGLVALPALRHFARDAAGTDFGADCTATANVVVAAARRELHGKVAIQMLPEIDALLRGETVPQTGAAADDEAERLFAEVVFGCDGADGRLLDALSDFAASRACRGARTATAFVRLLCTPQVDRWLAAWRCILRVAPAVAAAYPEIDQHVFFAGVPGLNRIEGTVVELHAQVLASSLRTDEELVAALASEHPRVVLRALAATSARPGLWPRLAGSFVALAAAAPESWGACTLCIGDNRYNFGWGCGLSGVNAPSILAELHAAAALLAAAAGASEWDTPAARGEVAQVFGLSAADEAPAFVARTVAEHTAADALRQIEDRVRDHWGVTEVWQQVSR